MDQNIIWAGSIFGTNGIYFKKINGIKEKLSYPFDEKNNETNHVHSSEEPNGIADAVDLLILTYTTFLDFIPPHIGSLPFDTSLYPFSALNVFL